MLAIVLAVGGMVGIILACCRPSQAADTVDPFVYVDEIYNNPENMRQLYQYLGVSDYDELVAAATATKSAADFRAVAVDNIDGKKAVDQDVVVTFGEHQWHACYLSMADKDGDGTAETPTLTLWHDGYMKDDHVTGMNDYVRHMFNKWYTDTDTIYPCNMYGTSYLRAWLNQGGAYVAAQNDTELTPWDAPKDTVYHELTDFLAGGQYADLILTPRQVLYLKDFYYYDGHRENAGVDNWKDDNLWLSTLQGSRYYDEYNCMPWYLSNSAIRSTRSNEIHCWSGTIPLTDSGYVYTISSNITDWKSNALMGSRPALCIDLSADELQAHEHEWGEWTETQRATCINDGAREHTCTVCNKTVSEPIPATGNHVYGNWIVDTAATCVTDGAQHCICVDDPECTARLDESVPATGIHTYDDGVETTPPGCATEGVMTYTCTQCHMATTTAAIPPTGYHHWNYDRVVKHEDPVCGEAGYKIYQCQDCTAVTREIVPPLEEHEYGEWETVTEATTDAAGEEQHECSKCGHVETREIPRLPAAQSSFTGEKAMVVILLVVGGLTCFAILIMTLAAMDKTRRQTQSR